MEVTKFDQITSNQNAPTETAQPHSKHELNIKNSTSHIRSL